MDHSLASLNVKKTERDRNDNFQEMLMSIDIKVELDKETNDDWCVDNFEAGNLLEPLFFKQVTEGTQCSLCFKYFLDQYDIYKHNLTHLQVTIVNPRFFRCDICGAYFDNIKVIERHMPSHNTSITRTLSYKPKSYRPSNKIDADRNEIKIYKSKRITANKNNDENFKSNLQDGMTEFSQEDNAETEKLYECDICHKSYSYRAFHGHMNEVHGAGKYPCSICDLVFKCERYLNKHLRKHLRVDHKPRGSVPMEVKCDQCDAVLQCLNALKTHKRNVHSDERFECHICKSRLKCKSYLLAHVRRVHSDGEKHGCECGKTFKTRRYLLVHKRNAHLKKKKDKVKTKVKVEEP